MSDQNTVKELQAEFQRVGGYVDRGLFGLAASGHLAYIAYGAQSLVLGGMAAVFGVASGVLYGRNRMLMETLKKSIKAAEETQKLAEVRTRIVKALSVRGAGIICVLQPRGASNDGAPGGSIPVQDGLDDNAPGV